MQKFAFEKEVLGLYVSGNPLNEYKTDCQDYSAWAISFLKAKATRPMSSILSMTECAWTWAGYFPTSR